MVEREIRFKINNDLKIVLLNHLNWYKKNHHALICVWENMDLIH